MTDWCFQDKLGLGLEKWWRAMTDGINQEFECLLFEGSFTKSHYLTKQCCTTCVDGVTDQSLQLWPGVSSLVTWYPGYGLRIMLLSAYSPDALQGQCYISQKYSPPTLKRAPVPTCRFCRRLSGTPDVRPLWVRATGPESWPVYWIKGRLEAYVGVLELIVERWE